LLTEALRAGRREDIPSCLALFRQHPINHIDQFTAVVNLLAWRGCETELRDLLEPTAQTIADSPDVIGGDFGLEWLTNLSMVPFLEAGDDSPPALDQLCRAAFAVGLFNQNEKHNREWLRRAVRTASRSPAEAGLDLRGTKGDWFHGDVAWSFTGWTHRTKGLTWISARFLANALLDYWGWREEKKKSTGPFGLSETRLDHYLAQVCRSFLHVHGVRALATLQAFHYFTECLVAYGYFSEADAGRLQAAARGLYETIRGGVDACDSAYRLCPTYEALIAGVGPPAVPVGSAAPGGPLGQ
jgi:hypothetical protein